MRIDELNAYVGIIGGIAGVGSLYYAWKNDKLTGFHPHDPKIREAFSGNENEASFIRQVHAMLQERVKNRRQLRDAYSIAKQMHFAKPMDDALIEINKRAIELGDLDFAWKAATGAYFALSLDQMLINIVNASLARGNLKLANKCANRMHFARNKDAAKKLVLAKLGVPIK